MSGSHYIPFAETSSYPARPGNRVRPLVGGPEIFGRLGEVLEEAQSTIWATVAFYAHDFRFPGDRGGVFDVLDRAVARGVDVRLIVWRPNPEAGGFPNMFSGNAEQMAWLAARGTKVKIRWDRATRWYCQHQKSWLIDPGRPEETAFVGGANVTASGARHQDMYVELAGPSTSDVHHNFVQRWNMATERAVDGGHWACDADDNLPAPTSVAAARGTSTVQIARMLPAAGERSVVEQYRLAIGAARRTIYIENQAIPIMEVAAPLLKAMERGVEVILLVPSTPEKYVFDARLNPAECSRFEGVEMLAGHPNFMMAGLGPTYVHNKTMIVDDCWATIGSCNLHAFSLQGHAEMNAGIWDADVAGALRRRLFAKHLAADVSNLDDRAAFSLYRQAAREGRGVYVLDPHRYGMT